MCMVMKNQKTPDSPHRRWSCQWRRCTCRWGGCIFALRPVEAGVWSVFSCYHLIPFPHLMFAWACEGKIKCNEKYDRVAMNRIQTLHKCLLYLKCPYNLVWKTLTLLPLASGQVSRTRLLCSYMMAGCGKDPEIKTKILFEVSQGNEGSLLSDCRLTCRVYSFHSRTRLRL